MNALVIDRPAIAAAKAAAIPVSQLQAQDRRLVHRERDFGIGYGRSSGYGCTRRYATLSNQRLFRCA
ncbi:hypothetical protein [Novilysobacter selenitireducens]|uniref:Uncharacterized protein n=1 Tax=Novilysobacter selenitireducens TaxID=2872639 RepID=A0ABS7T2Q4_9GAMM|nr:hypothetical protein [Lysobacter selenitireducens]MBZ4038143.1 hypothetical protein [Lysobacter selenitireducens]